MLDFCKHTFSIHPVKSTIDFAEFSLSTKFDLIWCGSLITHIDEASATILLKFFYNHLSPGGLCVFTTHGKFSIDMLEKKKITYGLTESAKNQVLSQFYERGYGYADYENQHGYGISAVSHERMLAIARGVGKWEEIFSMDTGWDNHQDVYGFSRPVSS